MSQIRNAGRQNVLRLVSHSLQHPSPNLAHFLMGYELRKPVSKTNLQDPGRHYVSTCKRKEHGQVVRVPDFKSRSPGLKSCSNC